MTAPLTQTARVALNVLSNYIRFGISLIVFFLLTPFVIGKVGENDFGLWSLTWATLICFTLLDFGFGTAVVRYVGECKGRDDVARRNRLLSSLAVMYVLLAGLGMIAVCVLSLFFTRLFSIPGEQQHRALALLWILGVRMVGLGLPLAMFRGVLLGEQRIVLLNAVQAASAVVYGFLAWMALARGYGIVALAWVNLAAALVEHLAYIVLACRFVKGLRISLRLADWTLFKEAASFSAFAFMASVATLVLLRTDPIIVKIFLSLSAVAVYAVGLRIAEQAYLLMKQFTYALGPFIAELKGVGDVEKIRFVLVNCAKFALAPGVLLTVAACSFSREAVVFWIGPQFAGAGPVLAILMIAMALSLPTVVASEVFTMTGNPKVTARASVIGVVLNLGASIALARPLGLAGVALGSLIATVVVGVAMIFAGCRTYQVRYRAYLRRVFVSTLCPGALQLIVTWAVKWWLPPTGLMAIALEALPGAALYLALFWWLFVEPSEKRLLADRLLKWRRPQKISAPKI